MLKRFLKFSLSQSGFYRTRAAFHRRSQPGPRLVVLVYHNCSLGEEYREPWSHPYQFRPECTQKMLDHQVATISRLCRVVSLSEGVRHLRESRDNELLASITFDDGYASFAETVLPVLNYHKVPATVFVATDYPDTQRWFWWDRLNQVIYHLWVQHPRFAVLEEALQTYVPDARREVPRTLPGARTLLNTLEATLLRTAPGPRDRILDGLEGCLEPHRRAQLKPERLLSWAQVRQLSARGVHFGSHTCSHLNFSHASPEEIDVELKRSRSALENQLDAPVPLLAYPYGGDLSAYRRARPMVEQAGYSVARTTGLGCNGSGTDPLMLCRIHVGLESSASLIRRDLHLGVVRTCSG